MPTSPASWPTPPVAASSSAPSGGRLLRYAVIADLVLVAIAAVVAVALLIAAWP